MINSMRICIRVEERRTGLEVERASTMNRLMMKTSHSYKIKKGCSKIKMMKEMRMMKTNLVKLRKRVSIPMMKTSQCNNY